MSGKRKVKPLSVGEFVTMRDSSIAEHGVKKGDLLYIAGDFYAPVTEEDPYLFRQTFIMAKTKDGSVVSDEGSAFACDGRRLRRVSKARQEKFKEQMMEDYGPKE